MPPSTYIPRALEPVVRRAAREFPAVVLTGVHAYQAGSDSMSVYFTRGLAVLIGIAVYPVTIRLLGIVQRRRAAL